MMSTKRVTLRLDDAEFETVRFWAAKSGISENDFIREAIELKIRHANSDYDLPTAEIQRLNQLVDLMGSVATNLSNLEDVTISGFNSLTKLTRGDNYLLDDED